MGNNIIRSKKDSFQLKQMLQSLTIIAANAHMLEAIELRKISYIVELRVVFCKFYTNDVFIKKRR